ncbi:hypothetical protein QBC37DRAFT_433561 [Rhypophila decipiens]|uniref:Uncharacterized protein n=1 Tax=Rhypophila decipiens TaxID=261697 RepID=A0AAN6XVE6_9PEZI|nr:hypothetical protein QBC37DRAFT_433561 [Rhypophila decipiens]
MGIILFELTYNYHPWKYAINRWRDGKSNEALRPSFQKSYQNDRECSMSASRGISADQKLLAVGGHFAEMVRYRWAANNYAQRPDIDKVLQHPAWGPLLPESPQVKRRLLEYDLGNGDV